MTTKKQQLKEIGINDFDIKTLRRAAREGRLFIATTEDDTVRASTADKEKAIGEILAYVDRISQYSDNVHVREIWDCILHDERLQPLFFFTRYSKTRGQINWYRVTAVVCLLREKGVYRKAMTAMQLHLALEGTARCTNRYYGISRYLLDDSHLKAVREILQKKGY